MKYKVKEFYEVPKRSIYDEAENQIISHYIVLEARYIESRKTKIENILNSIS